MPSATFWTHAADRPDDVAVVAPDGTATTMRELAARSNQVVHGLRALGLKVGDAVAYCMPNTPEIYDIVLAGLQAGFYVVPVNWHLTAPEIAYLLQDSGAKAFVAHERVADACAAAADEAGIAANARFAVGAVPGFRPYAELLDGQPATPPQGRTMGTMLSYTSGTTGRPKGVLRQLPGYAPEDAPGAGFVLKVFGIKDGDRHVHLVTCPLYHAQPINFSIASLQLGHTIVVMERFDAEGTLAAIEKYRATLAPMVPTQFVRLLALPEDVRAKYDVSSMRYATHAAAPCPPEVKRAMLEWWGPVVHEQYSASEGGGTVVLGHEWLARPGTVGRPWPGSVIKILDDAGNELPPGEVGTIYMAMPGGGFAYRGDSEKTEASHVGNLFTVGDMGYLDEEGWLFLCDRKSDMIISGGVNIYPAEIEGVLINHPQVADVAVFGIPHDEWGEEVKAVVQPVPGVSGDDALTADILAWAGERLARYKLPRSVDYLDELPREPTGKLFKRRLRDPYWENVKRSI